MKSLPTQMTGASAERSGCSSFFGRTLVLQHARLGRCSRPVPHKAPGQDVNTRVRFPTTVTAVELANCEVLGRARTDGARLRALRDISLSARSMHFNWMIHRQLGPLVCFTRHRHGALRPADERYSACRRITARAASEAHRPYSRSLPRARLWSRADHALAAGSKSRRCGASAAAAVLVTPRPKPSLGRSLPPDSHAVAAGRIAYMITLKSSFGKFFWNCERDHSKKNTAALRKVAHRRDGREVVPPGPPPRPPGARLRRDDLEARPLDEHPEVFVRPAPEARAQRRHKRVGAGTEERLSAAPLQASPRHPSQFLGASPRAW